VTPEVLLHEIRNAVHRRGSEALSFRSAAQALLTALAKETGATAFIMLPDMIARRMAPRDDAAVVSERPQEGKIRVPACLVERRLCDTSALGCSHSSHRRGRGVCG
jgi:hypothetical protein